MQSLPFRVTSRHSVEHIPAGRCQNHYAPWNALEFIDLNSCFCRLLVVKLIFRLLTEHSVFLFLYKYSGSFTPSKQSNFGADTQLTVSPIALSQYGVFYQSFSQPSRETAHSFSLFQVTFSVCCLSPSKIKTNRQHIPTCGRTIFALTQPKRWNHGWRWWQTLHLCRQSPSKGWCQCCHFVKEKKIFWRFEWRKTKIGCCSSATFPGFNTSVRSLSK